MKRALAILAILALLAPTVAAKGPAQYPSELLALAPQWIAEAEALGANSTNEPWYPEAGAFLVKAREAQQAGRLRVAMFDLETYTELVLSKQLMDEAADFGTDAEKKAHVVARTSDWLDDAERAWSAYRAKLHGYDGQLRSLQTVEKALYSADVGLASMTTTGDHEEIVKDFQTGSAFHEGYVLALVRTSHTPLLNVGYADDLLDAAVRQEGFPPRIRDDEWANLTSAAIAATLENEPAYLKRLEERLDPARGNQEGILAVAGALAEERVIRVSGMGTIFGDASTRGLDVIRDAARGMRKQLNNTSMEEPRKYGLSGVFTADAIDRAEFASEFVENQTAELGTVLVAWAGLDHQGYVVRSLGPASPEQPPPEEPTPETTPTHVDTPFAGMALVLAAFAIALASVRRRLI